MDGSGFDPEEVKDIAKNIMAFIKANAAVEGHTYWLYKSRGVLDRDIIIIKALLL